MCFSNLNRRKCICIALLLLCFLFSGYTFPECAPHVHIVNNGVSYDIYFSGTNFKDAFIYDAANTMLVNTYSSSITGYVTVNGVDRTASFPVYDFGNIRINDSYPYSYIYLNQITECEFIGFTESAWWKHDIDRILLIVIAFFAFINFIRR